MRAMKLKTFNVLNNKNFPTERSLQGKNANLDYTMAFDKCIHPTMNGERTLPSSP
jgi:hypothetical protein